MIKPSALDIKVVHEHFNNFFDEIRENLEIHFSKEEAHCMNQRASYDEHKYYKDKWK